MKHPIVNRFWCLSCCCLLILVALQLQTFASTLPSGFAETRIATGLDPTGMQVAPDGRIFVTIKSGKILIIKNGATLSTPFLNITVDNFNERGLQSMAFDPNFSTNNYIYVFYAVPGANKNRVSRFTANGDVVVPGSETTLIETDVLAGAIHNGGALFFKDGKLFITTGDGSTASKSQSMTTLLGKVLRINTDGSIPTDNPFYSSATGVFRAIYALGFRNPFKAAIDPVTKRVFVNDVGNWTAEEVSELFIGKNYGWPTIEGYRSNQTAPANYQDPIYAYGHTQGCAVTGGAFYNPASSQFPAKYSGRYFVQDYCSGWMRVIDQNTGALIETFATGMNRPIDVQVAPDGSMYYIARAGLGGGSEQDNTSTNNGEIWRIQYTGTGAPTISAQPSNVTTSIGGSATFVVAASGTAPLSYQWQRNGVNISGATSSTYTISQVTSADNGANFRAVVSNPVGTVTSQSATLTVSNNTIPVANIISPVASALYTAGTTLTFQGSATDAEDGELPASAFTWKIDLHHDDHSHPAMAATTGVRSGTFNIPTSGETSSNVWYRIYLTVKDSNGATSTIFRDHHPNKVNVTLASNPSGLQINLDGTAVITPYTFTGVVGVTRTIEAVSGQAQNGVTYDFASWSDGGAIQHDIKTPASNATFTATFTPGTTAVNLALNKPVTVSSTENSTNPGSGAVDGSTSTRWSSTFSDPQWIYVDLGSTFNINRVKILWEAAYGRNYEIQGSANATSWTAIKAVTGNTALTNDHTGLTGSFRYIRIYGTARGTVWGYSIYELEVYGISGNQPPVADAGPDKSITLPTNSILLSGTGTDRDGTIASYAWTRVSGPNTPTMNGANTATLSVGGLISGIYVFRLTVTDNQGASTSDEVNVVVSAGGNINLALNKPTFVSSTEVSTTPGRAAVDGNTSTRWSSSFSNNQWIYVDLGGNYSINRVRVLWEAAFGRDYQIQVSSDASNWTTIKTINGNTSLNNDHTGLTGTGRYLRILGITRGTVWGYSLWELEVYGVVASARLGAEEQKNTFNVKIAPNPVVGGTLKVFLPDFQGDVHAEITNLQGLFIYQDKASITKSTMALDISHLKPGEYVLVMKQNGKAITKKFLVN